MIVFKQGVCHIGYMDIPSADYDFIKKNLKQPIVLIGTGGAGKTTIGKIISESLALDFLDSDAVLEANEGKTIPQIFTDHGEPYFRAKERETIMGIINQSKSSVIGTGGGAFMDPETRKLILEETISIFIDADIEVLLKRVGNGVGRPLFNNKNPQDVLTQMIEQRYPIYNLATLTVKSEDEPIEQTAEKVINSLYKYLSSA